MPDKDVVERNLRGPWRAVYRMLKGGQPSSLFHDELLKALAVQLREEGGIAAHSLAGQRVHELSPATSPEATPGTGGEKVVKSSRTEETQEEIVSLYQRYCDEWVRFPAPLTSITRAA